MSFFLFAGQFIENGKQKPLSFGSNIRSDNYRIENLIKLLI